MMYILYSLTSLSAVLQEVVSVTVSTIQYSNAYHSIQYFYTIALILMNTVGTGPSPTWQGNTNYNFEI